VKLQSYLLSVGLIIGFIPVAEAQLEPVSDGYTPIEVYRDEYVITVSTVPALRDRAVAILDDLTRDDLEVIEDTSRALLVAPEELLSGEQEREIAEYDPRDDLCEKLRKANRLDRVQRAADGTNEVIRRISCSPNTVMRIAAVPNDQYYSLEWGLSQSNDIDMDLPEAWEITKGSNEVVIAVIDTGVDYNHQDLAENMWRNPNEIAGNGIDDDNNGVIDDVYGFNAASDNGNPMDDQYHGTHVAGTIGAVSNNGIGIAGVAWNVKIMAVKFLTSTGSGSLYDAIQAIDYVTMMKNRGVNIVASNNSWGGGGYMSTMYDAIARARNAGVLFIAAAGNNTNNNDSNPYYPVGYAVDNVVGVAALDSSGNLASFSNYGATSVHVGAPGVSIASCKPGNQYQYLNGTSMAAPHVSGVVALLKSYNSGLSYTAIRNLLLQTGVQMGALAGKTITGRMVNAYNALTQAAPPGPTPTPTHKPTPAPTATPTNTPTPTPSPTPTLTPTPQPPGHWAARGSVLSNLGAPLGDVKLVLSTANGVTMERYSSANGAFSFDSVLGPTTFTVIATKAGYQIPVYYGTLNADQTITLAGSASGYAVSGIAISPNGAAIAGANISAGDFGSAVSDALGRFTFTIPYGASYTLSVEKTGYRFSHSQLSGTVLGDAYRVMVGVQ